MQFGILDPSNLPGWSEQTAKPSEPGEFSGALKKRWFAGDITPADFLRFGRQLIGCCNQVYQGCEVELLRNRVVAIGYGTIEVSHGLEEVIHDPIDFRQMTEAEFGSLMASCRTLTVVVRPSVQRKELASSFGIMEWTRERPRTLFFESQVGLGGLEKQVLAAPRLRFRRVNQYREREGPGFDRVVRDYGRDLLGG